MAAAKAATAAATAATAAAAASAVAAAAAKAAAAAAAAAPPAPWSAAKGGARELASSNEDTPAYRWYPGIIDSSEARFSPHVSGSMKEVARAKTMLVLVSLLLESDTLRSTYIAAFERL
jgi:hypothetical protein